MGPTFRRSSAAASVVSPEKVSSESGRDIVDSKGPESEGSDNSFAMIGSHGFSCINGPGFFIEDLMLNHHGPHSEKKVERLFRLLLGKNIKEREIRILKARQLSDQNSSSACGMVGAMGHPAGLKDIDLCPHIRCADGQSSYLTAYPHQLVSLEDTRPVGPDRDESGSLHTGLCPSEKDPSQHQKSVSSWNRKDVCLFHCRTLPVDFRTFCPSFLTPILSEDSNIDI